MHSGGEAWLLNPKRPYEFHVRQAGIAMEQAKRDNYKHLTRTNISEAEMAPFYESLEKAVAMASNYQLRWGAPIPEGFVCIQPEQKMQVPIPGTEHDCERCKGMTRVLVEVDNDHWDRITCSECDGRGTVFHYLEGRIDGLLQRVADGSVWVLERKTYGQRPKIESLQFNDQFIAYLWMLRETGIATVGGIAYDGLWSRATPPRGSTLEDLFLRHLLTRSSKELDTFGANLKAEVELMAHVQETQSYIPNRQWQGCFDCGVSKICDVMMRGDDPASVIRTQFVERTDDVVETEEVVA